MTLAQTDPDAAVLWWRDGPTGHVRLNRPGKLNAITNAMNAALLRAWTELERDEAVRCIVLSGSGDRAFCAGGDLSEQGGDGGIAFGGGLTGIGGPLLRLSKPLIAVVHGYCLGGGFEMVLCADIVVAADDAVFGLPETQAGIIDHCGVVHRAARRLPHAIVMGMILAGERLNAQQAARHGLINQIVARSDLDDAAARWAKTIAACPGRLEAVTKAVLLQGLDTTLDAALAQCYPEITAYNLLKQKG